MKYYTVIKDKSQKLLKIISYSSRILFIYFKENVLGGFNLFRRNKSCINLYVPIRIIKNSLNSLFFIDVIIDEFMVTLSN